MVILTKVSKKDFEKILEEYDIGEYKESKHLWWAVQNTVFLLHTTKGKYIIKIFEDAKPDYVEFQIRLINSCFYHHLPVAKILKKRNLKSIFEFSGKPGIIQEFVKGRKPLKLSDKLVVDFANNVAKMDKVFMRLPRKGKFIWKEEYYFTTAFFDESVDNVKLNFDKFRKEYLKKVNTLNKKTLRKSIIHADLCFSNFLVEKDKVKLFFDFDDAHETYLVGEVAVIICENFFKQSRVRKDQAKLFLKEYQKYIKFNEEEKKAIYYFMEYRYLAGVYWCSYQQKIHKDKAKEIATWARDFIGRYKQYRKIPIEEFLSWF